MNALDRENRYAPGKLWSLWDMINFDASRFTSVISLLTRQIAGLRFYDSNKSIEGDDLSRLVKSIDNSVTECDAIGLSTSSNVAYEISRVLSAPNASYLPDLIRSEMESILNAVKSEMKSYIFTRISNDYTRYYKAKQPFGEDVADRFPAGAQDIEAGCTALACGLGTATVFHMMRVMELGLKVAAKKLGIPYAPSWESYITQIEKKIAAKPKTKTIKWKRDEPFFRDLLGDLQAVKIAWRNPTMHIVRHYNQDEGEDVLRAVKRFMCRLAENGLSQT